MVPKKKRTAKLNLQQILWQGKIIFSHRGESSANLPHS